jgi:hypothetical protein
MRAQTDSLGEGEEDEERGQGDRDPGEEARDLRIKWEMATTESDTVMGWKEQGCSAGVPVNTQSGRSRACQRTIVATPRFKGRLCLLTHARSRQITGVTTAHEQIDVVW